MSFFTQFFSIYFHFFLFLFSHRFVITYFFINTFYHYFFTDAFLTIFVVPIFFTTFFSKRKFYPFFFVTIFVNAFFCHKIIFVTHFFLITKKNCHRCHWIGPLGRFSNRVAMSVCTSVCMSPVKKTFPFIGKVFFTSPQIVGWVWVV